MDYLRIIQGISHDISTGRNYIGLARNMLGPGQTLPCIQGFVKHCSQNWHFKVVPFKWLFMKSGVRVAKGHCIGIKLNESRFICVEAFANNVFVLPHLFHVTKHIPVLSLYCPCTDIRLDID